MIDSVFELNVIKPWIYMILGGVNETIRPSQIPSFRHGLASVYNSSIFYANSLALRQYSRNFPTNRGIIF